MHLCSNRPEGFGPSSHLYSHILTSCFLDTILVPLCTWLYLTVITILAVGGLRRHGSHSGKSLGDGNAGYRLGQGKLRVGLTILYNFFVVAALAMSALEIARLVRADLGIGLLPFTFVSLLVAAILRSTRGLGGRVVAWKWANLGLWLALAVTHSVKVAEEAKEGMGARKGSKYPESDELTDVAVMVGLYVVLAVLETVLSP